MKLNLELNVNFQIWFFGFAYEGPSYPVNQHTLIASVGPFQVLITWG